MNTILAKNVPTKNTTNVWAVYMEGQNEFQYCKSATKALRYMFLLKARTNAQISKNCIEKLKGEIARIKAEAAQAAEADAEADTQEVEAEEVVATAEVQTEVKAESTAEEVKAPAPKRRGRPRKVKTEAQMEVAE